MDSKEIDSSYQDDPNANDFLMASKIPIKPHNFKLEVSLLKKKTENLTYYFFLQK